MKISFFSLMISSTLLVACGGANTSSQLATDDGSSARQERPKVAPQSSLPPMGKVVEAEAIRYERGCAAERSVAARCFQSATDVVFGTLGGGRAFRKVTDTEIEHHDVIIRKRYENGAVTYTPVGWGTYYPEDEEASFRSGDVNITGRKVINPTDLPQVEQRIENKQSQFPEETYSPLGGLSSGWNCQEMAKGIWNCIP